MRSEPNTGKRDAPGLVGTPHGRFVHDGTWQIEFHMRASTPLSTSLGNTRLVLLEEKGDEYKTLQQKTDYYPFGMVMNQTNPGTGPENKLLYNGKEIQDDVIAARKLDWYDYGARFYDAQIGRFHSIDPLAEVYSFQSPFAYAANNPIRFIDVLGLYAGEAGKWNKDDENFDDVLAYWGIVSENNDNENSPGNTDHNSRLKEKAKTNPWGAAGEFYGMAASISGGGFHAAMRGRDPLNPSQEDEDKAGEAFMLGVTTIIALPGGGGALVGRAVIKGGKLVFRNAPRAYNSTAAAISSLKDMGMHGYVLMQGNIASQVGMGIPLGVINAYLELPPGSVYSPFLITNIVADLSTASYFYLEGLKNKRVTPKQ